jgi:hypothetical protein
VAVVATQQNTGGTFGKWATCVLGVVAQPSNYPGGGGGDSWWRVATSYTSAEYVPAEEAQLDKGQLYRPRQVLGR